CALILFGAITVTFLPVDTMRGSSMKFLQVKPITHVMRSFSSVSGLNVTATWPVRFLHAYSASSSPGAGVSALLAPPPAGGPGCAKACADSERRTTMMRLLVFMIHRMLYLSVIGLPRRVTLTSSCVASRSFV